MLNMLKRIKNLKQISLVILALLIIYFAVGAAVAYGVYRQSWNSRSVYSLTKLYPYPVMIVNFRLISYSDYFQRVHNFTVQELKRLNGEEYLESEAGRLDLASKERQALNVLITEEFIRQYVREQRIKLPNNYLNEQYDKLISENGGQESFERSLKQEYRWSVSYFKNKVLKLELLKEEIIKSLCNREISEDKKVAEDIFAEVNAPDADFAELARKYSEDEATAASGGLLGTVDRTTRTLKDSSNVIHEDIIAFIDRAEPGRPELIRTCLGYTIIKVEERTDTAATIRLILIRTANYDDLEHEFRVKSSIKILVPGLTFNQDTGSVELITNESSQTGEEGVNQENPIDGEN